MLGKPNGINVPDVIVACASVVSEENCAGSVPVWTIYQSSSPYCLFISFSITCHYSCAVAFHYCFVLSSFLYCVILISIQAASGSAEDFW